MRLAGRILRNRDEAGHAAAFLVLPAHEVARALRRDQHHVEILARLDLLEVNVEAVREQQRRALLQALLALRRRGASCARSGTSSATRSAPAAASTGVGDGEAVLLRLLPARAALAHPDDDVEPAVLQVQRMRAALAAIARGWRCARPSALSCRRLSARTASSNYSRFKLQVSSAAPLEGRAHKKPRSGARPVRGSCVSARFRLGSGVHECPALAAPKEEQYERRYEQGNAAAQDASREIDACRCCCGCHVAEHSKTVKKWADVSTPRARLSTKREVLPGIR